MGEQSVPGADNLGTWLVHTAMAHGGCTPCPTWQTANGQLFEIPAGAWGECYETVQVLGQKTFYKLAKGAG